MYGASTPAEARVAPSPGVRASMSRTLAPADANSHAMVEPTTPAPITVMEGIVQAGGPDCILPSDFGRLPSAFCLLPSAFCLLPSAVSALAFSLVGTCALPISEPD